jgi:hypothetical protein
LTPRRRLATALFLQSFALVFYELLLTRLFAVTLFADFAHLALALALLGVGVGAMLQHLWPWLVPDEGLERRVGLLGLLQGGLTVAAVVAAIRFPVLKMSEVPPTTYQDRSFLKDELLDPVWFLLLLPVLALPFAVAGLSFSGVFERRKSDVGFLYGADLIGAAGGAVVFLPALALLAGPDTGFLALAACAGALAVLGTGADRKLGVGAVVVSLGLAAWSMQGDLLPIREAAGYSERRVVYTEWTPLTRLAVHRDKRGDYMLLDNTSASEIIQTEAQRNRVVAAANRAAVYRLMDPPARVAILAASAGPEVAVAEHYGFTEIDAIDIASEIFDIVADRYPEAPANPYLLPTVRRVHSDGRAAILRAEEPYDVIQMVHANLWSAAGLMANTWSPALLETKEAFQTYLRHLSPDGTISFGKGDQTDELFRSAVAALEAEGVADPHRCVAMLGGNSRVLLVKKRPWTDAEVARLREVAGSFEKIHIVHEPAAEPSRAYREMVAKGEPLTDDHPYGDSPRAVKKVFERAAAQVSGEAQEPLAALYRSFVTQCVFVLLAGLVFLGIPLATRGRSELRAVEGAGWAVVYVACLGYGYLAVETVLIHELVLFVGHPTYAVTTAVLAMLSASGLGSLWASRPADADLARTARMLLAGVVGLGALIAFAGVPALYTLALHLPLAARLILSALMLAPLAFLMGTAFPVGVRLVPPAASRLLPWAWAINGWMSVVGSLATMLVARMWGYTPAFAVALAAYAIGALVAPRLARIRG